LCACERTISILSCRSPVISSGWWYCASNSGLDRGFAVYRDFVFPRLTAFKTAVLVNRPLDGLKSVERLLTEWLDTDLFLLKPAVEKLFWLFKSNRKGAAVVSGEFVDWLSHRHRPERPFFAFLNYFDPRHPYNCVADLR
jgi:hypothetical protein